MNNREVYFKIEMLDPNDKVVEVKTPVLKSGSVTVSSTDSHRRKCEFTLLEPLPPSWLSSRWRLFYGQKIDGVITYDSLGVFLPMDPVESETPTGKITSYQGVDKRQLLMDSIGEVTIQFTQNQTLKEVVALHLNGVDITKQNLVDLGFYLRANYIFGDDKSANHTLSTIVNSFTADFYFDRNGIAVLENLPPASQRPVVKTLKGDSASVYTSSTSSFKLSDYFNRVIVIGGTADTEIFRAELENADQIALAGRTITRHIPVDVAASQDQVDALAEQYLDEGTRIPALLSITNFPIVDLEVKQIIEKDGEKYEVLSFNIPLGLGLQTIEAGKVVI